MKTSPVPGAFGTIPMESFPFDSHCLNGHQYIYVPKEYLQTNRNFTEFGGKFFSGAAVWWVQQFSYEIDPKPF